ncbi:hypothetical protein CALVIDRAFT_505877 [Calocera viscosa TUFC12733]|uniref:Uncharacterized protein n=1 Tax=Calocera viscosa (strain TUFC12733) TaxID=1330018 RepID=A0A167H4F4_CALVF|nr:hypothetical protein CALVIDRAFT_505877 [Calocera viscosa TUFC12733]
MPQELLNFLPAYCIVGLYRLLTDPKVRTPVWDKCRHGVQRGAVVAAVWSVATWPFQKAYVEWFLMKTPKFTSMSTPTLLGYNLPFHISPVTWATLLVLSTQSDFILHFFLSKNLRIARARAYDLTLLSRNKPAEFWGTYVEEWKEPPPIAGREGGFKLINIASSRFGAIALRQAIVFPLIAISPLFSLLVNASLRALGMAKTLHAPYFVQKKMTPAQVTVFMEERKWDYRSFGFAAALFESVPFVGILLSVSNRIGAAMWAFDLEKRQEMFRKGDLKPVERPEETLSDGREIGSSAAKRPDVIETRVDSMAGQWK